jgi:hypothetical protein
VAVWCAAALIAAVIGGCGGAGARSVSRSRSSDSTTAAASRPSLPPVCAPEAAAVIGRGADAGVVQRRGESNASTPQCVFRAAAVKVTVVVDSYPQPYQRLERAAVENGQQFGAVRLEAAPESVTGIGLDAWWFPTEQQLMTTEGRRLITVIVAWRGVRARRREALAEGVARHYLGPLDRAAAEPAGT